MNTRSHYMVCLLFTVLVVSSCSTIPDWRDVTVSPLTNIREDGIDNPVLEATDVTDVVDANFVADPFLFYEDGVWYMFFEVGKRYHEGGTHWGRIGLATSHDGTRWTYDRIVLDEIALDATGMPIAANSLHHSYPQVIKHNGIYYMITESYRQHQIRFFQADSFPYEWRLVFNIAECGFGPEVYPRQCFDTDVTGDGEPDVGNVDPSIFRFNGKWWLYGSKGRNGYLYHSNRLLGDWQEHDNNPVVPDSAFKARAGGRVIVYDNDRVIRIAQEYRERYGQRVRAFDVITLTDSEYLETEILEGASFCTDGGVFCEVGTPDTCNDAVTPCEDREDIWNLCGMHQLDAWWTGEHWLLVTDGYKCLGGRDNWSIGMFISGPPAARIREPFMEKEREPGPIRPDTRIERDADSEGTIQRQVSPDLSR
ncbi:MAG: hypothetical protein LWX54_15635 [Deltaproteobacteria bacterium]|nr:hypothetical protein [Deltaproteobacteria bacterium]